MSDDETTPAPDLPDTEMRRVTFPDGTSGVIAVKKGLSQDEADLFAARMWAELPE
ncbi:MAG: hypothetical protein HOQ07_08390 [Sinomonas sp.]|nr:hypothetical protein [Sinomonas sp.]